MHPQILGTWSWERQALAIGTHNLVQNNGKSNLFSQNWSKNNAKKNRRQDFYDIFKLHVMPKTGTADLTKCILNLFLELAMCAIRHMDKIFIHPKMLTLR